MILATSTTEVRIGFALTVIGAMTLLLLAGIALLDRTVFGMMFFVWVVVSVPLAVVAYRDWWVARTYGDSLLISDDVLRYGRPLRGFIRTDANPPKGDMRVSASLVVLSDAARTEARYIHWTVETVVPENVRERDEQGRLVVPFSLLLGDAPRLGRDPQLIVNVRSGSWVTSFAARYELGRPLESRPHYVA